MKWLPLRNAKYRTDSYRCHYCGRTAGSETGDHDVPKTFGGRRGAEEHRALLQDVQHNQERPRVWDVRRAVRSILRDERGRVPRGEFRLLPDNRRDEPAGSMEGPTASSTRRRLRPRPHDRGLKRGSNNGTTSPPRLAAAVFALIGLLQLARAGAGWEATSNGVTIPIWASWIAAAVGLGARVARVCSVTAVRPAHGFRKGSARILSA